MSCKTSQSSPDAVATTDVDSLTASFCKAWKERCKT